MTKEKRDQIILGLLSCIAHTTLALSILFKFGPIGRSEAWSIASQLWQDFISPGMFLGIAVLAGIGTFNIRCLRWSLYVGAWVMWVWSASLATAWWLGFGPQPSVVWIACIGFIKWRYGDTWVRLERQTAKIQKTATDLAEFVETSNTEHEALDIERGNNAQLRSPTFPRTI